MLTLQHHDTVFLSVRNAPNHPLYAGLTDRGALPATVAGLRTLRRNPLHAPEIQLRRRTRQPVTFPCLRLISDTSRLRISPRAANNIPPTLFVYSPWGGGILPIIECWTDPYLGTRGDADNGRGVIHRVR